MTRPSTLEISGLEALLSSLGIQTPIPAFTEIASFPTANVVDIYRLYLAQATIELLSCDPGKVYDGFQRTTHLSNGDLSLVSPRLAVREKRPDELAAETTAMVCKCKSTGWSLRYIFWSC